MKSTSKLRGVPVNGCSCFRVIILSSTSCKALTWYINFGLLPIAVTSIARVWQWCRGKGKQTHTVSKGILQLFKQFRNPSTGRLSLPFRQGIWVDPQHTIHLQADALHCLRSCLSPSCVHSTFVEQVRSSLQWHWRCRVWYYYLTLSFNIQGRHLSVRDSS